MRLTLMATGIAMLAAVPAQVPPRTADLQFVFTSDAHYGLTRAAFRGAANVDARTVNRALVAAINQLALTTFPSDGGNGAGQPVGGVDAVIEGGDVANREESVAGAPIQPAARSWQQFEEDYGQGLTLADAGGRRAALLVVPGNHEASNAVGFYRPMQPAHDPSAIVGIYNLLLRPARPLDARAYDYDRDRVLASRDIGGVHLAFVHVWPDSRGRAWLDRDLARVPGGTPVFLFAHDEPDVEAKHFRNPVAPHGLDAARGFENLLADELADGDTAAVPPLVERRALERFVGAHPGIVGYFHGNSNWNQFYDWTGPDGRVALHTFRVDSPMKGAQSSRDETRLSFQVATVSRRARTITVRECLWNATPASPSLTWGGSVTLGIRPSGNHPSTGGE